VPTPEATAAAASTATATAPEAASPEAAAPDTGGTSGEAASEDGYDLALALLPLPGKPSAAFTGLACLPALHHPELRPAYGVPNLT
jgi:hypothetical protein